MVTRFILLFVSALMLANSAWSVPSSAVYWSAQDCVTSSLGVAPSTSGNPTKCQGFIDRDPGGGNDTEDVLNSTPIYDNEDGTGSPLFTGFFGHTDWDFAQKKDNGGALTTDIDLGLTLTLLTDPGLPENLWLWDIVDGSLGAYEHAIAVIKQADGFDAYLLSEGLGDITGGSFISDWSHFSIYVRGEATVPAPGALFLMALGLLVMCWSKRR